MIQKISIIEQYYPKMCKVLAKMEMLFEYQVITVVIVVKLG